MVDFDNPLGQEFLDELYKGKRETWGDDLTRPRQFIIGRLNTDGSVSTVVTLGEYGRVWVRQPGDDAGDAVQAINTKLQPHEISFNRPVMVKTERGKFSIVDKSPESANYDAQLPVGPQRATNRDQYRVALITPSQPDSSFFVSYVGGMFQMNNNTYWITDSESSDLSGDVPGSDAISVKVEIAPETGTWYETVGSAFTTTSLRNAYKNGDLDTVRTKGRFLLGWIRLYDGQTAIEFDDIKPSEDMLDIIEGAKFANGFEKAPNAEPPTDSVISYDPATRTIGIAPTGDEFWYWLKGIRYKITSNQELTHADTTATYFFYWNSSNVLTLSTTPWSITDDVPISYCYYNASLTDGIYYEERHGADRALNWHYSDHYKRGTFWHLGEGLAIADYTLSPGSPADADNQWSISAGEIHDEDIAFQVTGRTTGEYEIFWRTGAGGDWTWTQNNVPFLTGGSYLYYNQFTGGAWQQTALATNNYVNYYIMSTSSLDSDFDVFVIMGQNAHSTLIGAQSEDITDLDFGDLPFQELLSIYKVTFRTSASYSNEGKCRIEAVADTRLTTGATIVNAAPGNNHPSLSGLDWVASGHTGTANKLAGFDGAGASTEYDLAGQDTIFVTDSADFTTTSVTFVELDAGGSVGDEAEITLATSGGNILFGVNILVSNSSASDVIFFDILDVTTAARVSGQGVNAGGIARTSFDNTNVQFTMLAFTHLYTSAPSGTNTYRIQWRVSGGTGTAFVNLVNNVPSATFWGTEILG